MAEYIEREKVMDALLHEQYGYLCEDAIKRIPAADVAPVRHGRWIEETGTAYVTACFCSECNAVGWRAFRYCQNCGAKMDGGQVNG